MNNKAERYFLEKLLRKPDASERIVTPLSADAVVKNVHLTGICGKGMASLAGLLVEAGFHVTGSDQSWNPPMSTMLEKLGFVETPFSEANVQNADLVVMGNAFSPSNVEAIHARKTGVPQVSFAQAFSEFFIRGRSSIVVAGTHGKTTTTGMLAHIFLSSGTPANILVGGVMKNTDSSHVYGGDDCSYSIVEGDEYDSAYFDKAPKFLHYRPTIGIITAIEFDHADIYDDLEDYINAFMFFAGEIPENGVLLISEDVPATSRRDLLGACRGRVLVYGHASECDIVAENVREEGAGQSFDIVFEGSRHESMALPLSGFYNVSNSLAAFAAARIAGISTEAIRTALSSFAGMKQRQEVLFDENGITVYDDFAHHPTAVSKTLEGLRRRFPSKRIISVFEPRSATSRRKDFEVPYSESFGYSDVIFISTPPFKESDDRSNFFDPDAVVQRIKAKGKQAFYSEDKEDLVKRVISMARPADVIVVMSNGHFDGFRENLVAALKESIL